MADALVLSHVGISHELGHLEAWLDDAGFRVARCHRESAWSLPAADLLIVLGSPSSVAAGHRSPAGESEVAAVQEWLAAGRPYLGICFGAQVLARATGGTVTRLPWTFRAYTEVEVPLGEADVVRGPWATWHQDAITAPASAEVLGSLDHADLVFRVGRAWGFQPHVEVDADILERMAVGLGASPEEYGPIVDPLRADASANARRARALFEAFAADALT